MARSSLLCQDLCPPTDRPGDLKPNVGTVEICSTRYRRQQQQQQLATAAAQSVKAVVQQPHDNSVAEGMVELSAPCCFFPLTGCVCSKRSLCTSHQRETTINTSVEGHLTSPVINRKSHCRSLCRRYGCRYWVPIS